MKNCDGDAQQLRDSIDNIVQHYKGNHTKCSSKSRCRTDNPYIPSKIQITSPVAEALLVKYLHNTPMYKAAERYRYCMDTQYVESFNNALLQYQDKQIVLGKT